MASTPEGKLLIKTDESKKKNMNTNAKSSKNVEIAKVKLVNGVVPLRAVDLKWSSQRHLAVALFFERCDLTSLLKVRAVCREFRTVAETLLRARQTVKFFNWPKNSDEYHDNGDEIFTNLRPRPDCANAPDPQTATFISRLMPNIISVHIFCVEKWQAQMFLILIPRWGEQLEQLTVHGFPRNKALANKLVTAIFKLPRLRFLTLSGFSNKGSEVQLPSKLPALRRLEVFNLDGYHGDLTPVLTQLGPPIRRLLISTEQRQSINLSVAPFEAFIEENPEVGAQLIEIDLVIIPDETLRLWYLICRRFTALRKLRATFLYGATFDQTLPPMKQLTSLKRLYFNVEMRMGPHPETEKLEPFTNITDLFLGSVARPCFDMATFHSTIGRLFPNLEDLRISTFSPKAIQELDGELKRAFPRLKRHQIGLANRSSMSVGLQSYLNHHAIR